MNDSDNGPIPLSAETLKFIDIACKTYGMSRSELVETAVDEWWNTFVNGEHEATRNMAKRRTTQPRSNPDAV